MVVVAATAHASFSFDYEENRVVHCKRFRFRMSAAEIFSKWPALKTRIQTVQNAFGNRTAKDVQQSDAMHFLFTALMRCAPPEAIAAIFQIWPEWFFSAAGIRAMIHWLSNPARWNALTIEAMTIFVYRVGATRSRSLAFWRALFSQMDALQLSTAKKQLQLCLAEPEILLELELSRERFSDNADYPTIFELEL